ncbi:MAG TPA: hypothetical protein VM821_05465, partial [Abditibacteriaceae bacterium]|nr:hypothetical protein [Abditibacteriaceae bacterium]
MSSLGLIHGGGDAVSLRAKAIEYSIAALVVNCNVEKAAQSNGIQRMKRVRIGVVGAGTTAEWGVLPVLSGPDSVAPPDTGAWWARRADSASSDIRYQPPARPEVVAICDLDRARAERVAQMSRVRAVYTDWRAMLREVELDAVVCTAQADVARQIALALPPNCGLWIEGLPSYSLESAQLLENDLRAKSDKLWCARIARQTAAHRAARRLVERDQIGAASALSLRWGTPFAAFKENEAGEDESRIASSYAALDLLLAFASGQSSTRNAATPLSGTVSAFQNAAATTLTIQFDNGLLATALFAGAESWSAPLPRLEVCGTQGRFLVCEAGRRLWLHQPREAARFWEPPGLSHHVSGANINGLAEDMKGFFSWCAAKEGESSALLHGCGASLVQANVALHLLNA